MSASEIVNFLWGADNLSNLASNGGVGQLVLRADYPSFRLMPESRDDDRGDTVRQL